MFLELFFRKQHILIIHQQVYIYKVKPHTLHHGTGLLAFLKAKQPLTISAGNILILLYSSELEYLILVWGSVYFD